MIIFWKYFQKSCFCLKNGGKDEKIFANFGAGWLSAYTFHLHFCRLCLAVFVGFYWVWSFLRPHEPIQGNRSGLSNKPPPGCRGAGVVIVWRRAYAAGRCRGCGETVSTRDEWRARTVSRLGSYGSSRTLKSSKWTRVPMSANSATAPCGQFSSLRSMMG